MLIKDCKTLTKRINSEQPCFKVINLAIIAAEHTPHLNTRPLLRQAMRSISTATASGLDHLSCSSQRTKTRIIPSMTELEQKFKKTKGTIYLLSRQT
jgi:hypothetical protein